MQSGGLPSDAAAAIYQRVSRPWGDWRDEIPHPLRLMATDYIEGRIPSKGSQSKEDFFRYLGELREAATTNPAHKIAAAQSLAYLRAQDEIVKQMAADFRKKEEEFWRNPMEASLSEARWNLPSDILTGSALLSRIPDPREEEEKRRKKIQEMLKAGVSFQPPREEGENLTASQRVAAAQSAAFRRKRAEIAEQLARDFQRKEREFWERPGEAALSEARKELARDLSLAALSVAGGYLPLGFLASPLIRASKAAPAAFRKLLRDTGTVFGGGFFTGTHPLLPAAEKARFARRLAHTPLSSVARAVPSLMAAETAAYMPLEHAIYSEHAPLLGALENHASR